jgi:exodeoxyribonuclease VII large subunit
MKGIDERMQQELKLFDDREIRSVSQVVHAVKVQLETRFRDIWVKGEISNFKPASSGHYYFTLKDNSAQLRAVFFRTHNRLLKFAPKDGMEVFARGSISVYSPRGEFQMVIEYMEPAGQGALQIAFEQLKTNLQKEGLFDTARKKKLPLLPSRIGVVTSPTGAAIQDILKVLKRRNEAVNVLIVPVRVQGEGAAAEIARGIKYLNTRQDIDVIIVGRGGGSLEDLWAFNEEVVARAIYASEIPVISAVGHEVDFTIADFVADLRAPTPSAAAEMVSGARAELCSRVDHCLRRASQAMRLILSDKRRKLQQLASNRAFVDAESRLRFYSQRLDDLHARLLRTFPARLPVARESLARHSRELGVRMQTRVQNARQHLTHVTRQLQAFSPLAVIERGYAIVTHQKGVIVRDPGQVPDGGKIDIRVARGSFGAVKEPKE